MTKAVEISIDFNHTGPIMLVGVDDGGERYLVEMDSAQARDFLAAVMTAVSIVNKLVVEMSGLAPEGRNEFAENKRALWSRDQN